MNLPSVLFMAMSVLCCVSSAYAIELGQYEECILDKLKNANTQITLKSVKSQCSEFNSIEVTTNNEVDLIIENRVKIEKSNYYVPFTLLAFKPNYILPIAYNAKGYDANVYRQQFNNNNIELDKLEAQFQFSIKVPLVTKIFDKNIGLFAAYTNRSFWQLYNDSISAPFRETNHEPEIWLAFQNSSTLFGFKNTANMLGFAHQSNGSAGVLSRSWNKVYANFLFSKENLVIALKIWSRINEKEEFDDNPDLTDYLGHGQVRIVYKLNRHTFSALSRNNLESGFQRGAVELSWSFPFSNREDLKAYIQTFSGYGESLIVYNSEVSRIGIGIVLSDWL